MEILINQVREVIVEDTNLKTDRTLRYFLEKHEGGGTNEG